MFSVKYLVGNNFTKLQSRQPEHSPTILKDCFIRIYAQFLPLKHISHTVNRQYITGLFGIFFDLISEMRNVNVDIVNAAPIFIPPNIGKDMVKR